jgi:spermidine synthase
VIKKSDQIYIISFCEGAAVMATELCGTKLIAPYFGSSLYVWSSVIAITLGSLAAGYFFGGKLSLKENKKSILTSILVLASLYMGCMPLVSGSFRFFAFGMPLIPAVVLSGSILLFFPMFLMGATSPLIISLQTQDVQNSGRVSGLVYSISTVGGIISTFLSGFYLIPAFGLQTTLIIFAILLLASLLLMIDNSIKIMGVFGILIFLGFKQAPLAKNCIYEKEGLLGKLDVLDDSLEIIGEGYGGKRRLLVNHVVQSEMDLASLRSVSDYVGILDANIEKGSGQALVLGLGGGLTANLLLDKGYKVAGVELDQRIIDIAKKYFYMNSDVEAVCDDARHYLNITNTKLDVLLIDIFKAEEQPSHVITVESLQKIKSLLNPDGKLIINWHGYSTGKRGLGTAILLNTLKNAGFQYRIAASSDNEDYRNLVIFSSLSQPKLQQFEVSIKPETTTQLNSDGQPVLEKANALANQSWRKNYILYYYSGI